MKAKSGEAIRAFDELSKVETNECVLWPFSADQWGHGFISVDGKTRYVPSWVCEQRHGPRPAGFIAVNNLPDGSPCVSPRCMNYRHLQWRSPNLTYPAFLRLLATESDECLLWPFAPDSTGYGQVVFPDGKVRRPHSSACEYHHGPRPDGMHAAHCRPDGSACASRLCVNGRHLSWKTYAENHADSARHGTQVRGEKSKQAKLTEEAVHDIRRRINEPKAVLAAEYGVAASTISSVQHRRQWKWLPEQVPA